jgi:hypothetical protein
MKKKTMKIQRIANDVISVNGKYYQLSHDPDDKKLLGKPLTKKEMKTINSRISKIVDIIAPQFDSKLLLKDVLASLDREELAGIHKRLTTKPKAKPKTSEGCLEIIVGKHIIPIR